jgi:hypothetical protein
MSISTFTSIRNFSILGAREIQGQDFRSRPFLAIGSLRMISLFGVQVPLNV